MQTSDKNSSPFLNSSDYDYIEKLQKIDASLNKLIDEIIASQFGELDLEDYLIENNSNIANSIATKVALSGLVANFSAGGYKITNVANGASGTDVCNIQTAESILATGGTPSSIPITSLGIGTGNSLQLFSVNAGGTAIVPISYSSIPVTGLGIGAGSQALQLLRVNANANAIEAFTFKDDWNAPVQGAFNAGVNSKNLCHLYFGSFPATLPANPSVGNYFRFKVYGNENYALTIQRNGCVITSNNVNIDPNGDGNLILNAGDCAELVCIAANTYEVI